MFVCVCGGGRKFFFSYSIFSKFILLLEKKLLLQFSHLFVFASATDQGLDIESKPLHCPDVGA